MEIIQPTLMDCLVVGGRTITDIKNIIVIAGTASSNTVGSCPRKWGGAAGYTPSGTKKFQCLGVRMINVTNSGARLYFASCDNDIGISTATAPINPQYWGTGTQASAPAILGQVASQPTVYEVGFDDISGPTIPNGKFGYMHASDPTEIHVFFFGKEV